MILDIPYAHYSLVSELRYVHDCNRVRAVASLTVPGGQEFHFPHSFLKSQSIFLIFPQTFLICFLILALRRPHGKALATPLAA